MPLTPLPGVPIAQAQWGAPALPHKGGGGASGEPAETQHSSAEGRERVLLGEIGAALGTVVAVLNFGAGDLLELKPASGGASVLVPFTRDTVPEVDVEGGRLTLAPPEGLFEP